jgi:carboxyl-terminal processing protease
MANGDHAESVHALPTPTPTGAARDPPLNLSPSHPFIHVHRPAVASTAATPPTPPPPRPIATTLTTLATALLLSGIPTLVTPLLLRPPPAAAVSAEQLLFLEAWRAVDRAYVDKTFAGQPWFRVREKYLRDVPMRSRAETHAAIRSLLASLDDPFTRFLDPAAAASTQAGRAGSVVGVGLEIGYGNAPPAKKGSAAVAPLVVVAPAPGGPADRAGVRAQDALVSVGGVRTAGLSLYEAGALLTGDPGSQVTLDLVPAKGGGGPRSLTLTREKVAFPAVQAEACKGGTQKTGYLRLAAFSRQTSNLVGSALADLTASGVDRVVLDVRNNGGGDFPAAVEVARAVLPGGEDIVLIADAAGIRDTFESDGVALKLSVTTPLVVLANRGTASAAEVLAGALQDNGRAAVAGEVTFGKGLIQTLVPLSDGSAVAVTVAQYRTPSGSDIHRVGISPDLALADGGVDALPIGVGGANGGSGFCAAFVAETAPDLFGVPPTSRVKDKEGV